MMKKAGLLKVQFTRMALFKNNHWISLILLLCFISCKSTQKPPLPNIEYIYVSPPEQDKKYDSILYWFPDNYIPMESGLEYKKEFLSDIKKNYSIKQGKIFYRNILLDRVMIRYRVSDDLKKNVIIEKGLPAHKYEYVIESVPPYLYDDAGRKVPRGYLLNIFNNGYGDWTEYYFVDYFNEKKYEKDDDIVLKEKGQVKINFKYGKWEYYNKVGNIDSTKTYTLQDSVDVRFPHCIFNKNEPCY